MEFECSETVLGTSSVCKTDLDFFFMFMYFVSSLHKEIE